MVEYVENRRDREDFAADMVPEDSSMEPVFMVPQHDAVSHPSHYTQGGIECIDALHSALGEEGYIGFLQGNALKYVWRHRHKGKAVEDLRKAIWYLDRLISVYEGEGK